MRLRELLSLALVTSPALSACEDEPRSPSAGLPGLDAGIDGGSEPSAPDAGRADASCTDSSGLEDLDHDGFARSRGDCDDCDPGRSPGLLEVPANGIDDDCSGSDALEAVRVSCDEKLKPGRADIDDAVKALGLCKDEVLWSSRDWGVLDARWLRLDGGEQLADPRQVWLPEHFGAALAREGGRVLVLSTGVARDYDEPDFTPGCDAFGGRQVEPGMLDMGVQPPAGYPRDSSQCKERSVSKDARAFDDVGFELSLRAPQNATAIAFDSIFYTHEYPDFVCSRFNDFFVVLMDEAPIELSDDNILFDDNGDPVGVSSGYLAVCRQSDRASENRRSDIDCAAGPGLLAKTGFDKGESSCALLPAGAEDVGGASTGWLHTEVPVRGGQTFKLRFILWDSGDPALDSTVVLDSLQFLVRPPVTGTKPITSG